MMCELASIPPLLAGYFAPSPAGHPIALAQARLISPSLFEGPPSATTASTLLPFLVFVTTARHPITTPATPLMIIGGTTTKGTVAESTYLNGDERGSGFPSLPGRCREVAETKAPGHGSPEPWTTGCPSSSPVSVTTPNQLPGPPAFASTSSVLPA